MHIEPHQAVQREITVSRTPVGTVYLTVQRQHQGKRIFGYGVRRIGRYANDRQLSFGRFQIHIIKTGTTKGQQFDTIVHHRIDHSGIGGVVDKDTDRVRILRQDYIVRIQMSSIVANVVIVLFIYFVE